MTSGAARAQGGLAICDTALVVLAAGQSTRMGSPKALVEFDGRPLLEHLLASPLLREFGDVVVVLGHHAEALRPIVDRLGYRSVLNPDPDRGRTGSVQMGLKALPAAIRAVFVQPVDCPMILPETYLALVAAIGPDDVAIPGYRGRHGHPPLFSAALIPEILAAGPDEPLRDLLQGPVGRLSKSSYEVRCRVVEVDDPGVLANLDRPEDLQQLTALHAARRGEGAPMNEVRRERQ
jgi:molybdenum cofactor cytidylyltransferase